MPAQAAILERHNVSAREEDSNPPRLGRGNTRGSTEERDHFNSRGRADHRHPSSKRNNAGAIPAGSNSSQCTECAARLLSGVSLVRCQGEEPLSKGARPASRENCPENSRTLQAVRGASPWCSAFPCPCSSTDLELSSPKGQDASATLAGDTNARMVQKQHA